MKPVAADPLEEIRRQGADVAQDERLLAILDAMPIVVLVLNRRRQILYANAAAREGLGRRLDLLLGARPGEAFSCPHAREGAGCGTNEKCTVCGAARALACALGGRPGRDECRILTESGRALDYRVWTTPLRLRERELVLFAALDVGEEKRRTALESIFFHDALNMVGAVRGLAELLPGARPAEVRAYADDIARSARQLDEELSAQRDLAAAERGELIVEPAPCEPGPLLESLAAAYRAHDVGRRRAIEVSAGPGAPFVTSRVLLARVLGNLLKNALEAEPRGAVVSIGGARETDGRWVFWVRNPSVMPRDVQLQAFQRSFSTKDPSRGLGLYGAKLLTEAYLRGSLSFRSEPGRGTEFRVVLPACLGPAGR